jgi:hypothetical protein
LDVRINEVNSQVRTVDSKAMLDPAVMRQIGKACVKAMQEHQERQKHLADERSLTPSASSD